MGLGVGLGELFGDVLAVGEAFGVPPVLEPRPCRTIAPTVPSSRMTTTAMTAGTSHAGRSTGPRSAGRRATVEGLGAGARMGVGGIVPGAGWLADGDGAAAVDEEDGFTSAAPADQTGAAAGDQVCFGVFVSG